jgi:hypothetical protein
MINAPWRFLNSAVCGGLQMNSATSVAKDSPGVNINDLMLMVKEAETSEGPLNNNFYWLLWFKKKKASCQFNLIFFHGVVDLSLPIIYCTK